MKKFVNNLKFSESGVRGIVGEGLTAQLAAALAAAFAQYVGVGKVVLGRDTRPSGEMFANAVAAALLASGCEVFDVGVVPTPTVQILVPHYQAKGGIVITASHNPEAYNALKFIDQSGSFLDRTSAGELFDLYSQGAPWYVGEGDYGNLHQIADAFDIHLAKIWQSGIDIEAIKSKHFKVALDSVNGVGALYSENFLQALGCEVFSLNGVPDGHFARRPEPVPSVLTDLAALVKKEHCAIGFAQDPDGDRLTLVDNAGNILSPHLTVALAIDHVLGGGDETAAVVNIQTTRTVADVVDSYGGELFYSKVGEINVVNLMKEHAVAIGGEGNCGGVIWSKVHYGRDSFVAMALLLEMLSVNDTPLTGIVAELPCYYNLNAQFDATPLAAREVLQRFFRRYAGYQPLTFDGLKIDFESGWVLMRFSNTEPILRLNVESDSLDNAKQLLERFKKEITEVLKEYEKL